MVGSASHGNSEKKTRKNINEANDKPLVAVTLAENLLAKFESC